MEAKIQAHFEEGRLFVWNARSLWVLRNLPFSILHYGVKLEAYPFNLEQLREWMTAVKDAQWVPRAYEFGFVTTFAFQPEARQAIAVAAIEEFLQSLDVAKIRQVELFAAASGALQIHMYRLLETVPLAQEVFNRSPNLFFVVADTSRQNTDAIRYAGKLLELSASELCTRTGSVKKNLLRRIPSAALAATFSRFCEIVNRKRNIARFLEYLPIISGDIIELIASGAFERFKPTFFLDLARDAFNQKQHPSLVSDYFKLLSIVRRLGDCKIGPDLRPIPPVESLRHFYRLLEEFKVEEFPAESELEVFLARPLPRVNLKSRWLTQATTVGALRKIGADLHNCLLTGEREAECLSGALAVFYQTKNLFFPRAVLLVARDSASGRYCLLDVALGSRNKDISVEHRDWIRSELLLQQPLFELVDDVTETSKDATLSAKRPAQFNGNQIITVINDRYCGTYSGAAFTAWDCSFEEIPSAISGNDDECDNFWAWHRANQGRVAVGIGESEEAAKTDLLRKLEKTPGTTPRFLGAWLPS